MARLLVNGFTISLDGYGAGPTQSMENPLGVGGEELHDWLVNTRTFKRLQGREDGDTEVVSLLRSDGTRVRRSGPRVGRSGPTVRRFGPSHRTFEPSYWTLAPSHRRPAGPYGCYL
jgi:hypothetical protein